MGHFILLVPDEIEPGVLPVAEWPWKISNNQARATAYAALLEVINKDSLWIEAQSRPNTTQLSEDFVKKLVKTLIRDPLVVAMSCLNSAIEQSKESDEVMK